MAQSKVSNFTRPAVGGLPVSGAVTFDNLTRAIYVGVAGDLPVVFSDGSAVVISNAQPGYHPLELQAIDGAGLTAGNVIALF
jgi:hypothetical protein